MSSYALPRTPLQVVPHLSYLLDSHLLKSGSLFFLFLRPNTSSCCPVAVGGCRLLLLTHSLFMGLGTQVSYTAPRVFLPDGEGNQDWEAGGMVGRDSNFWPFVGEGMDLPTPGACPEPLTCIWGIKWQV